MSYSEFTNLNQVQAEFNLLLQETRNVFAETPSYQPSGHPLKAIYGVRLPS